MCVKSSLRTTLDTGARTATTATASIDAPTREHGFRDELEEKPEVVLCVSKAFYWVVLAFSL